MANMAAVGKVVTPGLAAPPDAADPPPGGAAQPGEPEELGFPTSTPETVQAEDGGSRAPEFLLPLVYDELRKLATAKMANEAAGHTLQPTALVHEAWLRLSAGAEEARFDNRGHFFAAAAESMRRILIDSARRKGAHKRGGGLQRVNLEDVDLAANADDTVLLRIDEALELLAREDPPSAELVKLRFFAGLTTAQAACALGISERTARRYWLFARAWLHDELQR
jgi:RNA polymerase sigma factor (TIGR02999 family)